MAQIDMGQSVSLSLSAKNWAERKRGSALRHLPSLRPCVGAQVALQRCPILRTSASSVPPSLSTLSKGDISTLANRGHFYFGLTEGNHDFLHLIF